MKVDPPDVVAMERIAQLARLLGDGGEDAASADFDVALGATVAEWFWIDAAARRQQLNFSALREVASILATATEQWGRAGGYAKLHPRRRRLRLKPDLTWPADFRSAVLVAIRARGIIESHDLDDFEIAAAFHLWVGHALIAVDQAAEGYDMAEIIELVGQEAQVFLADGTPRGEAMRDLVGFPR